MNPKNNFKKQNNWLLKFSLPRTLLFFLAMYLIFILTFNSAYSMLVSKVEIVNSTALVSKPFFVPSFPRENKVPYYEVLVNGFKFKTNDLSFYIPVNSSKIRLKVVSLVNYETVFNDYIEFCNHDNVCQEYEFDTCVDCAKDVVADLNASLNDEIKKINSRNKTFLNVPEYYFYVSIAVLILILFVVYTVLYLNKRRNKRANVAINVLILFILGIVFLFISQISVSSKVGTVSKEVNQVISKAERLDICNRLYQQYNDDEPLLTVLFYGCADCSCNLKLDNAEINCAGFCSEFLNQFNVKAQELAGGFSLEIKI